jgi:N-methylhydantoinase A
LETRRIRVGIDVGGTFTKAVAIEMVTGQIIGKVTVPTTHSSSNGVSTGIIETLETLIRRYPIAPHRQSTHSLKAILPRLEL